MQWAACSGATRAHTDCVTELLGRGGRIVALGLEPATV